MWFFFVEVPLLGRTFLDRKSRTASLPFLNYAGSLYLPCEYLMDIEVRVCF
jgi:hypothetical protein